jgi:hypothetical protein
MRHHPSVDAVKLFTLWNSDLDNGAVSSALGVSRYQLYAIGRRYGLAPRIHVRSAVGRERNNDDVEIPTEEFEARKAEVQALWSDEEREKRRVGPTARKWKLPSYAYDGRVCAFQATGLD